MMNPFKKMTNEGAIMIDIKEYNDLMLDRMLLNLLQAGDVDNWDYWDEARFPEEGETYEDYCDWCDEANILGDIEE